MSIPSIFEDASQSKTTALPHCSEILLIGSALTYSNRFVRLVSFEFEGVDVRRVACDPLEFLLEFEADQRTLLVIEDAVARTLSEVPGLIGDLLMRGEVVVAYRSIQLAQELYTASRQDPALSRLQFLPMDLQMDRWISILQLLACRVQYMPQELVNDRLPCAQGAANLVPIPKNVAQDESQANFDKLTPREYEVLKMVADGLQNKAIARKLDRSEHTVKLHIHHINTKLSVTNRTAAAALYLASVADGEGK